MLKTPTCLDALTLCCVNRLEAVLARGIWTVWLVGRNKAL